MYKSHTHIPQKDTNNYSTFITRYKDIGELMRRCETLVATREDLTKMRDRIKSTISQEEESLAQFKDREDILNVIFKVAPT